MQNENEDLTQLISIDNPVPYNESKDDSLLIFDNKQLSTMSSTFYSGKITTITDELIGIGQKYSDYDEIEEIDLSNKNLNCFKNKKNINFTYLLYVQSINISKNYIKDISDFKYLNTVKILNISDNKIDDISALEHLDSLEILLAQNNEITSITTLNKCRNLRVLELNDNQLRYQISTLKTIQNLTNLKELTIKNNPVIYYILYLLVFRGNHRI
jgi:hypothetical protein